MILTVVSGTYNRLEHLKEMVESARASAPPGLEMDFSICDGGSTDGTLEWMRTQPDINIIEHGELKGAIKAFNDAAAAAKGDYLCIANDDITFVGWTLAHGLAKMMDDPSIGAGCFYQDRNAKDMHVESMPIYNTDGSQGWLPYMQVGLIPKWLWDKCGGWGDWGGRTYGGDNYLSGRVYESGYRVVALERCSIRDKTPIDELRRINNTNCKDGDILWSKFKGFQIPESPIYPNPLPERKRVLYAPIIEGGHDHAKQQKRGLREALKALGLVWEVDYVYSAESVPEAAEAWLPHLVVTQFHSAGGEVNIDNVRRIKAATNGHLINFSGDVWMSQATPEMMEILREFNAHLTVNASLIQEYAKIGIYAEYWQNSAEPEVYE